MAVTTFIPEVWASALLRQLEKELVYAQPGVISRDYEGTISQAGDTVHIGTIGAITVKAYTRNTDIADPDVLATTDQSLVIDQEQYFNFALDDVDRRQAAGDLMGPAQAEAAYALADVADQFVAGLYTDVDASMELGDDVTPTSVTTADLAYDTLVDIAVMLDEANVPKAGRFCIIPPWWAGLLAKDDRVLASLGTSVIPNGFTGKVHTLNLLQSNNVPNTGGDLWKVIAGYPGAWAFAQQVNKVEAYRPDKRFSDALKGLHIYGAKVVRPTKLVVCTASNGAGS